MVMTSLNDENATTIASTERIDNFNDCEVLTEIKNTPVAANITLKENKNDHQSLENQTPLDENLDKNYLNGNTDGSNHCLSSFLNNRLDKEDSIKNKVEENIVNENDVHKDIVSEGIKPATDSREASSSVSGSLEKQSSDRSGSSSIIGEKSDDRSSLDSDSDFSEKASGGEVRRSGRAPQKRTVKEFSIITSSKKPTTKSKSKDARSNTEDTVLLDAVEEVEKRERSEITNILSEISEQKSQDSCFSLIKKEKEEKALREKEYLESSFTLKAPRLEIKPNAEITNLEKKLEEGDNDEKENSSSNDASSNSGVIRNNETQDHKASVSSLEQDTTSGQFSEGQESSTDETNAVDEAIVKAIQEWYDVVSKKSHDEMDEEVDRILENDRLSQLRPNMKKANISMKAEERFQEHVFEKAKLRKRRLSEDANADDNDLYIPSQPKLYKKAFVVEDIREMEIDRWGEDYYLVKWEDWPEERNTWEPALHLDNCDMVIAKFRRKLKQMPEYHTARHLQLKTLQAFSDKLSDPRCPTVPKIEVINDVDLTTPNDNFEYRGLLNWPKNRVPISICCDCEECGDTCPCATMDGHKFAYKPDGSLKVLTGNPIYECSTGCNCSLEKCRNKVVQRGRTVRLQLFKTPNGRGWGLRTLDPIKKNTFVVEYVGEVLPFSEAELRGMVYDARGRTYLFDMDFFQKPGEYTIDAMKSGNEARYFNHACNPNLFSMCVWYNSIDPFYHHVAFFAKGDIAAGKELTINYKNAGLTYRHHLDNQVNKAAQAAAVETASWEGSSSASVLEDNGSGTSSGNNSNGDGAKEKVPCRCNKNCMEYLFVD